MRLLTTEEAAGVIRSGGVVAYPTESCYGIGCDPLNTRAVKRIIRIKGRAISKGVILIADHQSRFNRYVSKPNEDMQARINATWPGPYTWLIPARPGVPQLLRGSHDSVAVRVTAHRVCRELCRTSAMALISTSANRSNRPSIKTLARVMSEFEGEIEGVVIGRIGHAIKPSTITDATTGEVLRS